SLLFGGTPGVPLLGANNLKKFTQEVRLTSQPSERLDWQGGGYYTHEDASLVQHLNATAIPGGAYLGNIILVDLESTYKEVAGFADLTIHFGPQFDVQLGGRWSKNDQTADQTTAYNPAFGIPVSVDHGNSS